MEECKYRLPCNWCDKFDKHCDVTNKNECDHTLILSGQDENYNHYRCDKCRIYKIEPINKEE